jgi:glycolate oxidase
MKFQEMDRDRLSRLADICGPENVISDRERVLDYVRDESPGAVPFRPPEAVVKPRCREEVSRILELANGNLIPVTTRGGATGLCGGCVPLYGGIVLSLEKMDRIIGIDRDNFVAELEAGVPLMKFYEEIGRDNFFFPPHPGDDSAMVGGIIATSAGGSRALKYGVIRNFVRGLEVVLADGSVIEAGGKFLKNSAGYSLLNLMIGSEGTLGVITRALIAFMPPPAHTATLVIPYLDIKSAIHSVPEILRNCARPMAIEFVEIEPLVITEKHLDKSWPTHSGKAHLMIILDSQGEDESLSQAERISEVCLRDGALDVFVAETAARQKNILDIRSNIYEAIKSHTVEILDVAVPPASIAEYVNRLHEIGERRRLWLPTFGHAGDGNVHTHCMNASFRDGEMVPLREEEWKGHIEEAVDEIVRMGLSLGGTFTGEHGVGIAKKKYMPLMYPEKYMSILRGIKDLFDPNGILNPGKLIG